MKSFKPGQAANIVFLGWVMGSSGGVCILSGDGADTRVKARHYPSTLKTDWQPVSSAEREQALGGCAGVESRDYIKF